jgi:hypothetical protein
MLLQVRLRAVSVVRGIGVPVVLLIEPLVRVRLGRRILIRGRSLHLNVPATFAERALFAPTVHETSALQEHGVTLHALPKVHLEERNAQIVPQIIFAEGMVPQGKL